MKKLLLVDVIVDNLCCDNINILPEFIVNLLPEAEIVQLVLFV